MGKPLYAQDLLSLLDHHRLARPPPPPAMTHGEYEYDLTGCDARPVKRPRQLKEGDDGHRPFIPMSGASGVQAEGDNAGEGGPKKGRKRPLSCGECRRCVEIIYSPSRTYCFVQAQAQGVSKTHIV